VLRERALSGIFIGLPALGIVVLGGWWMTVMVFILGSIALIEFVHLLARREQGAPSGLMVVWMLVFTGGRAFPDLALFEAGTAVLMVVTLAWALYRYGKGNQNAVNAFMTVLAGGFYVGWGFSHFIGLRSADDGLFWTLSIILVIWTADTGAYLVGRTIGRRKLAPTISPNKTWEGYIGGIVFGTLMAAVLPLGWQALGASTEVNHLHGVVLGIMISGLSPIGDLGMSMVKRFVNAKDSSNLIPGHGGVLDRMDALLIGILLGYYYILLVVR